MVLVDIIKKVKDDTTLKSLLNATVSNSKISPTPATGEGIGYQFADIMSDGVTKQSQLKMTIIDDDLAKCYQIKDRLDSLLLTVGDNSFNKDIMSITQTGGGFYYDDDLENYKVVAIYTIQERMM